MHRSLVNFLDEVLVAGTAGLRTDTATRLLTEVGERRTLDIAEMRDSDDHVVVGVHIFGVELGRHLDDLGLTLVAVFLFDLLELGVDDVVAHLLAGEQLVEMRDEFLYLLVVVLQLVDTQAGERRQTHIHDSL